MKSVQLVVTVVILTIQVLALSQHGFALLSALLQLCFSESLILMKSLIRQDIVFPSHSSGSFSTVLCCVVLVLLVLCCVFECVVRCDFCCFALCLCCNVHFHRCCHGWVLYCVWGFVHHLHPAEFSWRRNTHCHTCIQQ